MWKGRKQGSRLAVGQQDLKTVRRDARRRQCEVGKRSNACLMSPAPPTIYSSFSADPRLFLLRLLLLLFLFLLHVHITLLLHLGLSSRCLRCLPALCQRDT